MWPRARLPAITIHEIHVPFFLLKGWTGQVRADVSGRPLHLLLVGQSVETG